jgi:hypothetical protein
MGDSDTEIIMQQPSFHSKRPPPPTLLLQQPRILSVKSQRLMFFALGHGESEKENFKNKTNVILIKEVRCGHGSDAAKAYARANEFYNLSRVPSNLDFLNENDIINPRSALSKFSKNKTISYPNNNFVEGTYTPLADFKNVGVTRVFTSGIYNNTTSFTQKGVSLTQDDDGKAQITLENLRVIFNGSLYPTFMKVDKLFKFLNTKFGKKDDGGVVIDKDAQIPFSLFKRHFSEHFSKTVSELLIFCRNKAQGHISVLYYPLCREISEKFTKGQPSTLATTLNGEILKLSDEMDAIAVLSSIVDSVVGKEGMGITKKKKKNHKKTWKKKNHNKKTQKKKK